MIRALLAVSVLAVLMGCERGKTISIITEPEGGSVICKGTTYYSGTRRTFNFGSNSGGIPVAKGFITGTMYLGGANRVLNLIIETVHAEWPDGGKSEATAVSWDSPQPIVLRKDKTLSKDGSPKGNPAQRASCDVRLIAIADASCIASATGESSADNLAALAKVLAGKLKDGAILKGEALAVVSFRNRTGSSQGRVVADELADKVQGALIDTGWFEVKERIQLDAVNDETLRAESAKDILNHPSVKHKIANVKYIVIGGVTVTDKGS